MNYDKVFNRYYEKKVSDFDAHRNRVVKTVSGIPEKAKTGVQNFILKQKTALKNAVKESAFLYKLNNKIDQLKAWALEKSDAVKFFKEERDLNKAEKENKEIFDVLGLSYGEEEHHTLMEIFKKEGMPKISLRQLAKDEARKINSLGVHPAEKELLIQQAQEKLKVYSDIAKKNLLCLALEAELRPALHQTALTNLRVEASRPSFGEGHVVAQVLHKSLDIEVLQIRKDPQALKAFHQNKILFDRLGLPYSDTEHNRVMSTLSKDGLPQVSLLQMAREDFQQIAQAKTPFEENRAVNCLKAHTVSYKKAFLNNTTCVDLDVVSNKDFSQLRVEAEGPQLDAQGKMLGFARNDVTFQIIRPKTSPSKTQAKRPG